MISIWMSNTNPGKHVGCDLKVPTGILSFITQYSEGSDKSHSQFVSVLPNRRKVCTVSQLTEAATALGEITQDHFHSKYCHKTQYKQQPVCISAATSIYISLGRRVIMSLTTKDEAPGNYKTTNIFLTKRTIQLSQILINQTNV